MLLCGSGHKGALNLQFPELRTQACSTYSNPHSVVNCMGDCNAEANLHLCEH